MLTFPVSGDSVHINERLCVSSRLQCIYLFICLPPAAFQETKKTDSGEDGVEVLCSAVQRTGAHALSPRHAQRYVHAHVHVIQHINTLAHSSTH